MVVMMVMTVSMMVIILMMMAVPVIMVVVMPVPMIVIMMVDTLVRAAAARVFAEQQRFDRDWHREGRHPDAAEIDVVEIAQHHAVDRQDLALDQELFPQDRPQRLRDVAVEHDVERPLALDRDGEPVAGA